MLKEELGLGAPACAVRASSRQGVPVVTVASEVDICTAPLLVAASTAQLEKSPAALIVDLSDVTFFASSGMSALLDARRLAADLRVVADQAVVLRPRHLAGMDAVFRLHPTLPEALRALA